MSMPLEPTWGAAAPVKGVVLLLVGTGAALEAVPAGTPCAGELALVGLAAAGAGVPAARPVAEAPLEMYTWGTTAEVLMTEVVVQAPADMEAGT